MTHRSTLILLGLCLLFALTAGIGNFVVYQQMTKQRNQLILDKQALVLEVKNQQAITSISEKLSQLSRERNDVDQYFFTEERVVEFIEQLESLAKFASITGEDFKVNTAAKVAVNNSSIYRFSVSVRGDWYADMYFLALLEALPLRIHISSVKLHGDGGNNSPWAMDISFDLLSFADNPSI